MDKKRCFLRVIELYLKRIYQDMKRFLIWTSMGNRNLDVNVTVGFLITPSFEYISFPFSRYCGTECAKQSFKGGLQFNSKIGLQYTIEVTLFRLYLSLEKLYEGYLGYGLNSLNYNKPSKSTTQSNSLCCRTSNL